MYELKPNSFFNKDNSNDELNENMKTEIKDNFCTLGEYFYAEYFNKIEEAPEELREFITEIKSLQDRLGLEPKSKHEVLDKMKPKFESAPKQEVVQEVNEKENLVSETVVEKSGLRKCPTCGAIIDSSFAFCTSCGRKMPADVDEIQKEESKTDIHEGLRKCLTCGAEVDPSFAFCTSCGCKMPVEGLKEEMLHDTPIEEKSEATTEPEPQVETMDAEITPGSFKLDLNPEMRKCPSCGETVKSSVKFCTSCGFKMPEESEQVEELQEKLEREIKTEPEITIDSKEMEEIQENVERVAQEESVVLEDASVTEPKEEGKRAPLFCVQCGNKLRPGARFCTECGWKIR